MNARIGIITSTASFDKIQEKEAKSRESRVDAEKTKSGIEYNHPDITKIYSAGHVNRIDDNAIC